MPVRKRSFGYLITRQPNAGFRASFDEQFWGVARDVDPVPIRSSARSLMSALDNVMCDSALSTNPVDGLSPLLIVSG